MIILDDVFSGLDSNTERHIFSKLLGPGGILRRQKSTVIIATHAGILNFVLSLKEEANVTCSEPSPFR